jgi:hypothetical protein
MRPNGDRKLGRRSASVPVMSPNAVSMIFDAGTTSCEQDSVVRLTGDN